MPGHLSHLRDVELDELSTVDVPAHQDGLIVLAKRASEDVVGDTDTDTDTVALEDLQPGDVVRGADGELYEVGVEGDGQDTADDIDLESLLAAPAADEPAETREPVAVGKSATDPFAIFGRAAPGGAVRPRPAPQRDVSKSAIDALREDLAKALTDEDRDAVIAKSVGELAKRADEAEGRVEKLFEVAKGERDLRLEREYIAKADTYNVPIGADELGPVLKRMAESMSYEDCVVIDKALSAAGEVLFTEAGYDTHGGADPNDAFAVVDDFIEAELAKRGVLEPGDREVIKSQATVALFDANPAAYDEYRASRAAGI